MGVFDDLMRSRKYHALRINVGQRILMRMTVQQIQKLYNDYVDPTAAMGGKRPVEEVNIGTIAMDFLNKKDTGRKAMINKIMESISLDDVINYANKLKLSIKDILDDYEEQKARI